MGQHEVMVASQIQGQAPVAAPAKRLTLREMLESDKFKSQLAMALPKHMNADRMLRVVLTSLRKNPKLAQCSPESFFSGVLVCAQLGLEPDDPRGLAHLLPYGDQCTVIIGYRGYIHLGRLSGQIANVQAAPVYKKDVFEFERGTKQSLRHVPTLEEDPGEVVAAYAIATLKDGTQQIEVVARRDLERARKASRASTRGPWVDWFPEMCSKTAVRRLYKMLPQSPEMVFAERVDSAREVRADVVDGRIDFEILDAPPVGSGDDADDEAGGKPQAEALVDRLTKKSSTEGGAK